MQMIWAIALGVLSTGGVFLLLRGRTFSLILGMTLLSYAVNLFLFGMGRLSGEGAIVGAVSSLSDPLPQALVLTAIVIGFAMTALTLALALRALRSFGSDRVDDPESGR